MLTHPLRRPDGRTNPTDGLIMRTEDEVDKAVRTACFAGVIAGAMIIFSTFNGQGPLGLKEAFPLFSGLLMIGLSWGLTRYNRMCAVALLLLYTAGKLLVVLTQAPRLSVFTGLITLVFVFAFVRGVQGTFAHHRMGKRFEQWQRSMDKSIDPRLFDED